MTLDFPEPLLDLERAAWEEIQAGQLTVATALAVRNGIDQYVSGRVTAMVTLTGFPPVHGTTAPRDRRCGAGPLP